MAKPTNELTPMQKQYHDLKEQNQDCILFSGWVTFMKCSTRMPFWLPGNWI